MKALWYERLNSAVRHTNKRKKWVKNTARWLPMTVAIGYGIVLMLLLYNNDPHAVRYAAVPATVFLLVTGLRRLLPFPRPYEVCDIEPLLPRKKHGCSLPSRHTASAAIIALGGFYVTPLLGAVFTALAVLVALTRLLAGVHFLRDLLAAFLLALLIGIPAFWLI